MIERLKDLIAKNYKDAQKASKDKLLFNSRNEVNINDNGTSGYKIKYGPNKDKIVGHITCKSKVI